MQRLKGAVKEQHLDYEDYTGSSYMACNFLELDFL